MTRIAVCQINATVGALDKNLEKIKEFCEKAAAAGADLALFPELTICGYPPEDLLLKPRFIKDCQDRVLKNIPDLALPALIGFPYTAEDNKIYNAAALIADKKVKGIYCKNLLPNYSVFDEKRYFDEGSRGMIIEIEKQRLGVVICEDAWSLEGPAKSEAEAGIDAILCLSASPFHRGKHFEREEIFAQLCTAYKADFIYCNLVGGQDELVFDGGSLYIEKDGTIAKRGAEFSEDIFLIDLKESNATAKESDKVDVIKLPQSSSEKVFLTDTENTKLDTEAEIYECLVLGVRDYVRKNGFEKAVIGLSGGIDSALTAAVAVDALGKENVTGVTLPSQYSSDETKSDAYALAENLAIKIHTIPIKPAFDTFKNELSDLFAGLEENLTEENLQARIRAVYLMALSNKFGWLVLNTSNKSESAVGYGTMYGDMIGAYAVLKDVFKTTVFKLSCFVNKKHGCEVIPETTITRPPTAELRPDQKDSDSIPEYEILDPVLEAYIEKDMSIAEMISEGFNEEVIRRAVRLTDINEWKRRQSVPGVRVTPKAFGKDRRMPLTNGYES
ncbi:MAG: NAD+ synthase [Planctomycetota bacterium]|jgi:NAD+ synthase (glutamine-hydrolysing)